jgi:PrtD family type I secretion system ABC transporter
VSACRSAFAGVAVFSALSNMLMLTGALFMLEVYDRVLPSRSTPTLVALAVLALMLFAAQGLLDTARSRILVRIGASLDEAINGRVFNVLVRMPQGAAPGDGLQPMRDLDSIRAFLSSTGPNALLDMPWLPFYLAIIFMFHWLLGIVALIGTIVLVSLTACTEYLTRGAVKTATAEGNVRAGLAEAGRRNAEVLQAMGLASRFGARYTAVSNSLVDKQMTASDVGGGIGAVSKTLRMILQSAMLGLGAWLVIRNQASGGIIIAGSILVGRALAPVDLAIANWKHFVAARQSWARLSTLLSLFPEEERRLTLPAPHESLAVEHLTVTEPAGSRIIIRDISFELPAGSGLGIIGPTASGKSTLARAVVGAWRTASGRVRLDGAGLDQWPREELGRHIGYLPQDVELFDGTVAENIARLEPAPDAEKVIAAARAAGVHDMIVNLRDGYQTQIGDGGAVLSAGQRQRIALARALYGDPFLVVLDEPNSNLDADGDRALIEAVQGVRARGGVAVVISHRPSALEALTRVLIMQEGRVAALGPRDEILARLQPAQAAAGIRGREPAFPKRAGETQGRIAVAGGIGAPRETPEPAVMEPASAGDDTKESAA